MDIKLNNKPKAKTTHGCMSSFGSSKLLSGIIPKRDQVSIKDAHSAKINIFDRLPIYWEETMYPIPQTLWALKENDNCPWD